MPTCTGWDALYGHTATLLCLDSHRPAEDSSLPALSRVSTPLVVEEWERVLSHHPDRKECSGLCIAKGTPVQCSATLPIPSPPLLMYKLYLHYVVMSNFECLEELFPPKDIAWKNAFIHNSWSVYWCVLVCIGHNVLRNL